MMADGKPQASRRMMRVQEVRSSKRRLKNLQLNCCGMRQFAFMLLRVAGVVSTALSACAIACSMGAGL